MSYTYIGLGSNLGDGLRTLQEAWHQIGEEKGVTLKRLSSPYLSAPVDMKSNNWFTNAVGCLKTDLTAKELLQILLLVEKKFGRKRDGDATGYRDRTLDLDILLFGDIITNGLELVLPHPHLHKRLFVLSPLAEIAADLVHPKLGLSMQVLENKLLDDMHTNKIEKQQLGRKQWSE